LPIVRYQPTMQGEGLSQQASLLVSILLHYPELASVRFGPVDGQILFSFMLKEVCQEAELEAFRRDLRQHLEAFMEITGRKAKVCKVRKVQHDRHTLIEVIRDVATLSQQELSLLLNLVRSRFASQLMVEGGNLWSEEDATAQEELIDEMLEDVRILARRRELVGYRDDGRVMVFNRHSVEARKN